MSKKLYGLLATSAIVLTLGVSVPANAGDAFSKDNWQFRLRGIGIVPDEDSTVNIGGDIDVGDAVVPEFDITYFFTKNVAAELILATAPHELDHNTAGNLGEVWLLPPTLTLQYHFTPDQAFSPYVGAGVNYTVTYGEDAGTGFTDLNLDNGWGYALQAGFDYWLDDNWGLNLDVKKIYLGVDASLNAGTVTADVDLDPWVFGAGISYRF